MRRMQVWGWKREQDKTRRKDKNQVSKLVIPSVASQGFFLTQREIEEVGQFVRDGGGRRESRRMGEGLFLVVSEEAGWEGRSRVKKQRKHRRTRALLVLPYCAVPQRS